MEAIKCKKCGSKYVYVLKDGTVVCRHCGFREVKKEGKKNHGTENRI